MTTVKSCFPNIWTFTVQNFPSIYQLSSDFVKQLFRIQIQKAGESKCNKEVVEFRMARVLLWNQEKYEFEACYSELILLKWLLSGLLWKFRFSQANTK